MKFDWSSTAQSRGVGVVLYHEENEVVALSFKLEFPCSNNTAEYEAYLTGLATALEMGVKHLKVVGDSNLVVCQTKGSFSLKEPILAPYRAMAQKIEERFSTFEIEHAPRGENRFVDALAALGSQIIFEGNSAKIEINKRRESIIEVLKENFREEQCEEDWRNPIREVLIKEGELAELKTLKDYILVGGELYRRMPGGILSREESYAVFASKDWREPFTQYLAEGVLPQKHNERYKLKRLVTRYFLHNGVLFKKGYDGDLLRCLGPEEAKSMIKEVHVGECGEHQGKKKLYRCLLQMGYYWPAMKKDTAEFGLDLVGPVNPPSRGYIWILVATEYFTKWAEAVPLRKATKGAVANFIKENIIVRFGVPHRIISDNGTPFVNNDVRKMLEFYQVKHH
ncbi:uncharacterized protein LOC142629513 [Castanea sativa]|uniref:uncharacterized protein LOC142629513 n=1 Tax=Castanea sativa TaxID=21020 RepID=UPI003F65253C